MSVWCLGGRISGFGVWWAWDGLWIAGLLVVSAIGVVFGLVIGGFFFFFSPVLLVVSALVGCV